MGKDDIMKTICRVLLILLMVTVLASLFALPALAAEEDAPAEQSSTLDVKSVKALAAGGLIAVAAGAGAVSMAISIGKSAESTARQPEASGSIRSSLMLGLVFLERNFFVSRFIENLKP